jgi:hypothetical protein
VYFSLRSKAGFPSLRAARLFPAVREALRAASGRDFRIVQFSAQRDRLHMIVEAPNGGALVRGARGVTIRVARAINNQLGRSGPVWADRYRTRSLTTPAEMREALVCLFLAYPKQQPADRRGVDPCSSAPWFDGFDPAPPAPTDPSPVVAPRTWLASAGWRQGGRIRRSERPPDGC